MAGKRAAALPVTRRDDFAEWYQKLIRGADLAETSLVRGCMIIKPWGYGIWERLQSDLDKRIKETGHSNCYFPLFIPLNLIEKEAAHVAGFAKEMAVVTHHRVEADENGKLIPKGRLEEPLVVRPTSETIIGEALSHWIHSYRDLPILINQWANVVRWELRPRLFLRTTEFLWQEGHTAHASEREARTETETMLEVYVRTLEEALAIPVITGAKTPSERFPGAVDTYCVEAMMQDGRALQAGTSHFLGQNFAKAAHIRFQNRSGEMEYAYTTSWGVSTRLIGALIMSHGDDDGLRLPPAVAPQQIVIIPIIRDDQMRAVLDYCNELKVTLSRLTALGSAVRCIVDTRDIPVPERKWEWIRKGVTLVCEVGPRDIAQSQITCTYRNDKDLERQSIPSLNFPAYCVERIHTMHSELLCEARKRLSERTSNEIRTWHELIDFYARDENVPYDSRPGFVRAYFSDSPEAEERLKDIGVTVRCIPFDQPSIGGRCVVTGEPTTQQVILAKAY
jgi:prolyl-tRNA synthetase